LAFHHRSAGLTSATVLTLNRFIHLAAMHWHFLGSVDPKAHLVTADVNNRDYNIVADDDALIALSRQNQHRSDSFDSNDQGSQTKLAELVESSFSTM